ncbi:MAG: hypothetical protein IJB55_06965 [Firmicutes bacterium]|nr:hypothetical protein [Bacillota bacterium]
MVVESQGWVVAGQSGVAPGSNSVIMAICGSEPSCRSTRQEYTLLPSTVWKAAEVLRELISGVWMLLPATEANILVESIPSVWVP